MVIQELGELGRRRQHGFIEGGRAEAVDVHQLAHQLRRPRGRIRGLTASLAVTDQKHRPPDPLQNIDDVLHVGEPRVGAGPLRIPMTARIDGDDPKTIRQQGRKHREAARVIPHAMRQDDGLGLGIAPFEEVELQPERFDARATLRGVGSWEIGLEHGRTLPRSRARTRLRSRTCDRVLRLARRGFGAG